jgi:hypothetical protein
MRTLPVCPPLFVIAAALAGSVLLAGCTGSSTNAGAGQTVTSTPSSSDSSSTAPPPSSSSISTPSASKTPSKPPTPSDTISIPPNLCAATDIAQNTADAYMGALSAGNEKEALDCVFPRTVPLATTESLLAKVKNTAVYLPKRGGADGPSNFDYVGNGKTITVTVTRQADHKTWVTKVAVR